MYSCDWPYINSNVPEITSEMRSAHRNIHVCRRKRSAPLAPSNPQLLCHTRTCSGNDEERFVRCKPPSAEKPSAVCVLSCVVGSGPPARTTSHRYLLISVSLGGKSIPFRWYCVNPFVQGLKRSPHPYPAVPGRMKKGKRVWR